MPTPRPASMLPLPSMDLAPYLILRRLIALWASTAARLSLLLIVIIVAPRGVCRRAHTGRRRG